MERQDLAVDVLQDGGPLRQLSQGTHQDRERLPGDRQIDQRAPDLFAPLPDRPAPVGDRSGRLPLQGAEVGPLRQDQQRQGVLVGGGTGLDRGIAQESDGGDAKPRQLPDRGFEREPLIDEFQGLGREEDDLAAVEVAEGGRHRPQPRRPGHLLPQPGPAGPHLRPSRQRLPEDIVDGNHALPALALPVPG
jgi:hypothetical protein